MPEHEGNERVVYLAKLGSLKNQSNPVYDKIPFKKYKNKIEKYYQKSIINRYKYSDISNEAKITTNELSKVTNYKTHLIGKGNNTYSVCKLAILLNSLSNHNNLYYHMT